MHNVRNRLQIAAFFFLGTMQCYALQPWSHLYTAAAKNMVRKGNSITFEKINISAFSQAIFSWHSVRPTSGYFSLYAQARDATTKQWGPWHRMIDWGAEKQCSYLSKAEKITDYFHVRLELKTKQKFDGFRFRVEGNEGARVSTVHDVGVATANYTFFRSQKGMLDAIQYPSVHLAGVPLLSQMVQPHPEFHRICSPVSCSMVISYVRGHLIDPVIFAEGVYDSGLDTFGSWPLNTAHAFDVSAGEVVLYPYRLNSFAHLHAYLMRGHPVMVSVRGELAGAPKPYPHGHLLVVVGWDNEKRVLICHDPAAPCDEEVQKRYSLTDFITAWERSYRLSYVPLI